MSAKFQSLRGTKDILPEESGLWQYVEDTATELFRRFGYQEIRTPIFERTELFVRSIGSDTDIVTKEMYTFSDKKGRSLTLRPEGTAPVVRAYLQNQLYKKEEILKLYYKGPFFRYERPQAGRERQFYQFGVEVLGGMNAAIDAEVIYLGDSILKNLGLKNFKLLLSSVGCFKCRPVYQKVILSALKKYYSKLCSDCKRRYKTNPLRILDCKNSTCKKYLKKIPALTKYLCNSCKTHLEETEELLKLLKINYKISPHLVRGLDYYTQVTFEFVYPPLGAQSTLIGGGRYNRLVKDLGGPSVPACGFAGGFERIILALKDKKISEGIDVVVVPVPATPARQDLAGGKKTAGKGDKCFKKAFQLLQKIRTSGISADMDYRGGSVKSQFRKADKLNAGYVVIIGEDEINKGIVKLKNMKTGKEENIKLSEDAKKSKPPTLGEIFKNKLK
jgi:histidyl-tRNA synthetase